MNNLVLVIVLLYPFRSWMFDLNIEFQILEDPNTGIKRHFPFSLPFLPPNHCYLAPQFFPILKLNVLLEPLTVLLPLQKANQLSCYLHFILKILIFLIIDSLNIFFLASIGCAYRKWNTKHVKLLNLKRQIIMKW